MTTSPWLRVIGIGEDGLDGLSARCRQYVEEAEVLVGIWPWCRLAGRSA